MQEDEIRCNRCHRPLSDSRSIAVGYGPICWNKISGAYIRGGLKQWVQEHLPVDLDDDGLERLAGMITVHSTPINGGPEQWTVKRVKRVKK